jgi:hypothetical protein
LGTPLFSKLVHNPALSLIFKGTWPKKKNWKLYNSIPKKVKISESEFCISQTGETQTKSILKRFSQKEIGSNSNKTHRDDYSDSELT